MMDFPTKNIDQILRKLIPPKHTNTNQRTKDPHKNIWEGEKSH